MTGVQTCALPIFAYAVGGTAAELHDTVTITVRYASGSIANINYFSSGDKSYPKEQVEVYAAGGIAILDDFRRLTLTRAGKRKQIKRLSQEKGFDQEVASFLNALKSGGEAPISLQSLASTTRATFAIVESLRLGQPVSIPAA